jgi:hypothetical protein
MSEEVLVHIKQLANRLHEDKPPDEDNESIGVDFHVSNNDEVSYVDDHRSDTEEYNHNTPGEVVNNNDGQSSTSLSESIRYESDSDNAEEEIMLEQYHYIATDPLINNNDTITDCDDNNTFGETNDTEGNEETVNISSQMDVLYGPRNSSYDLQPRKARDYGHLQLTIGDVCMTQYGLKKGLELFGTEGSLAVEAELRQLHDRKVILPINRDTLTTHYREMALPYLMFHKQKRSGQVKGRGCTDGQCQ